MSYGFVQQTNKTVTLCTQVLWSSTGFFNKPVLQLGQVEITDNNFGVLQAVVIHQILQLKKTLALFKCIIKKTLLFFEIYIYRPYPLKTIYCKYCACVSTRGSSSVYLQIAVDDVEGVQVRHGLQHLADHVAGVLLRVVALVQDPVKHLSSCSAETQPETTTVHT